MDCKHIVGLNRAIFGTYEKGEELIRAKDNEWWVGPDIEFNYCPECGASLVSTTPAQER